MWFYKALYGVFLKRSFSQGNYVPESDDELEMTVEEFDTILALSVTKWLQLNYGDAGLKRAFKK